MSVDSSWIGFLCLKISITSCFAYIKNGCSLLFTVDAMNKWQYYAVTTLITHLNNLNINTRLPRTQSTTKSLMITKLYPTMVK